MEINFLKIKKLAKKKWVKICLWIFAVFFLFFCLNVYFPLEPGSNKIVDFIVRNGEGGKEISINLKNEGLIRYSSFFRAYILFRGVSHQLQAGNYELSSGMAIPAMVSKMVRGEIKTEKITIIEGWNLKDIADYFEEQKICTKEEFLNLTKKDFSQGLDFLKDKPKSLDLEGYFFPDTYEVIPGTDPEDIIKKILSNFDEKLTSDLRTEIAKQKKTIFEIITMASMIEKEVKTLEDKKIVSGILWKRLEVDMPLQVDATVNYITGKNDDGASYDDIAIDSSYNTYKYAGLPKGPISNPGIESIIAAIYPKKSDYWYYLSTPSGKTIFSKTFKEHSIAQDKYLK